MRESTAPAGESPVRKKVRFMTEHGAGGARAITGERVEVWFLAFRSRCGLALLCSCCGCPHLSLFPLGGERFGPFFLWLGLAFHFSLSFLLWEVAILVGVGSSLLGLERRSFSECGRDLRRGLYWFEKIDRSVTTKTS